MLASRVGILAVPLALAHFGCGDDAPSDPGSGGAGDGGGGGGVAACGEGEIEVAPGQCTFPAGIAPDRCAEGFEPTGDDSCAPVLPVETCPPGQMAVPGDATCRAVAPCGDAPYAGIPVEATTEHVDQAYGGGASDGSAAAPWTTIQAAVDAAVPGAIVAIAAGAYVEDVVIQGKAVRLWGRCPDLVEIVGSLPMQGAVRVFPGVSGAEVRSLAIRGAGVGVAYSGAADLWLDQVWIHDTASRGIGIVPYPASPSTLTVSRSLVESTVDVGILVTESAAIDASVIRGTSPDPVFAGGFGVMVQGGGLLALSRSVVEDNLEFGVYALGAGATVAGSVVRRTSPQPTSGAYGVGILAAIGGAVRSTLQVEGSLVTDSAALGIGVVDSDVTLGTTVVRATALSSGLEARGATVSLTEAVFEDNPVAGVRVIDADADLAGILVRRSLGYGVLAQRSSVGLRSSRVEDNRVSAVFLLESQGELDQVSLEATTPDPAFGGGGDGLTIQSTSAAPAGASVGRSRITQSARAGISSFGATVQLSEVELRCNAIDLNGESEYGSVVSQPFSFVELGEVDCGCEGAEQACLVQSAKLAPPTLD